MANTLVELQSVDLVYPIYSIRAQSIRNSLASLAVGGKLLRDGQDVIHVQALSGISFRLQEGDSLGLIGHNGSGKTTLLKVIAGIYEPTKGRISINGRISSMIDIALGVDPVLTGRENIFNMGRMRGFTTKNIKNNLDAIVEFSELGSFIDLPVKTYSAGMVSRLMFTVATQLEPDILLFDEWLSAGDASFMDKAQKRINEMLAKSRGLVLASHSWPLIQATCNKVLVLDNGNMSYFGDTANWDFENRMPKATAVA